ncbi:MAG: AI-2E family transporter [Thermomicrobiales bacterium]
MHEDGCFSGGLRYVVGQSINSTLFALFTLVVLSLLDVPSAVALALFAAIGDAIPQVGVIIATIPAVILALTVSPQTARIGVLLALPVAAAIPVLARIWLGEDVSTTETAVGTVAASVDER